ncbi:hypothetical protein PMAYCL1PPCAC_31287 [Pristionchus mayeri]|uniref:Piwi domain-containing protein n=1 Tax=Pristionchus mayeri TaxID=1317129 RepID=A0AAN5ICF8_9BILA|nr:hypothetical protein PMAYCL1PPCAC_31287 [Pristionchus mayeri]
MQRNLRALSHRICRTTFMYDERVISIADYFLERYQLRLKYPDLPLIVEKKQDGKQSYHPIECMAIAPGVRVSNQKMTREAQESMITKSCRAPAPLGKDLETGRDIAQFNQMNKYLNAFRVKIKDGFSTVPAKILPKPFLVGMAGIRPDINERGQIGYSRPNFKFADPIKLDKPIYFVSVDNALDNAQIEQVKNHLLAGGTAYGMKIHFSGPSDPRVIGGQVEIMKRMMMSEISRTSMFFFVTPEKIDENHYIVKKLEQELGVVTELIWAKTALDLSKPVTRYNVVAKINQKLGGVVANPEVPPELKLRNPTAYARAVADWFPNRMFIGLSLSHGGALSFTERVGGEEVKEPTCVGMAFTLRQTGKRTAVSWFIEKKKPIIDDLTRHFIHALDVYAVSNNKKMPTSIMIFRKGMSEGELKKAAYEMNQVKEAIKQISAERPELKDYRPTVQCIVCMANTSDRLFYKGRSENVPAGTVLEKEATNPERLEFIIVAHNAIKGTAKPVKCTVVKEMQGRVGRRLPLSEIESIYHTLCYINGVAASPTRLPVPLSDSEKAAERQMNNYKEAMRSGEGGIIASITRDGGPENYRRLSDHFAHKFRNIQYYA